MKISVIIPVYNAEDSIMKCVESYLVQQYDDLEIILIDDNSCDNSFQLCEEISRKHKNIFTYKSERNGVSAARNTGLKYATGDIISFCDADDTAESNILSTVKENFDKNKNIRILVSGYKNVLKNGTVINHCIRNNCIWNAKKLSYHVIYDRNIMGSVCNKFFRREILEDILFDETLSYCEDTHFVMRVLDKHKNENCLIINDVLYNYYENPKSVTLDSQKMFDSNGKLKYISAMEAIIEDCSLTGYGYCVIRKGMFKLAAETLWGFDLSDKIKGMLFKTIKQNILYFLLLFFVCDIYENIKISAKLFLILLKMKR